MNKLQNLDRVWLGMFSQTGNELFEVSKNLGRFPDVIITDRIDFDGVNRDLLEAIQKNNIRLIQMTRPTVDDYRMAIPFGALVTLHGYLKILPPEICDEYEIFNGHPGDIVLYPELKGKDPQAKAIRLHLPSTGCVIHSCSKDLDGGQVIARECQRIDYLTPLEETVNQYYLHSYYMSMEEENIKILTYVLHDISIRMWTNFLEEKLIVNPIDFDNHPSTDINTLVLLSFTGYF